MIVVGINNLKKTRMGMIFYRYEKRDGGGPYFTRNGMNRITGEQYIDSDTLDGALTKDDLYHWFLNKENVLNNCRICTYDGELLHINYNTGNAIFRKSTAIQII